MDGWMDIPNLGRTEPEAWLAGKLAGVESMRRKKNKTPLPVIVNIRCVS